MNSGKRIKGLLTGLLFSGLVAAQQNPSMFLMYEVPESNLMNPAVPLSCPWYVGMPVLSSVYANYGNSLVTYNQLFRKSPEGSRRIAIEQTVASMHRRDFIGTEAHVQLLALGHKKGDYSIIFTVTEKNNLPFTLSAQGVQLLWNGNRPYEGQKAGLNGTGVYFTHYREYAVSVSKQTNNGLYFGVRAKLLFGKLNLSVSKDRLTLKTDDKTFDLQMDGDFRINSSLPVIVHSTNGKLNYITLNENISLMQLIFNSKNPGFSLDAGMIYPYNERLTLSASVIDFGFIRWRSNLNNMAGSGSFVFRGTGDLPQGTNEYFTGLVNEITDSMHIRYVQEHYVTPLPLHLMAGADYRLNENVSGGLVAETYLYRSKINTALTGTGRYRPVKYLSLLASYTLQYNSLNNIGAGLVIGRNPVQFYIVSTTIPGWIRPLDARSLNIRFGLNILLGCRGKGNKGDGGGMSGIFISSGRTKRGSHSTVKCHDGLPVKEKAYKKKIKVKRQKAKVRSRDRS